MNLRNWALCSPGALRRDFRAAIVAALVFVGCLVGPLRAASPAGPDAGRLRLAPDATARFRFAGPVGDRIDANVTGWLLPCPGANPGLLEMFRVRDRQPAPQLVPWAGEFVGKYLISAIQALQMVEDTALEQQVAAVIAELCVLQAEDGYLGPFPRDQRMLGHWDLWGHYHVMQALLMWHERTGDQRALDTCRRAADLMARIYLDGQRRVFDAGSHEMNMAVIHGLGRLYRITGEPRYRQLMAQIEGDWERAGDYFRTGLAGEEFFRTPRPRWESLHDLQGLVELYRITGDERYRQALLHHWASIRRWDRRNSGAFSSGEQATGNPYEPTPIETCCTIAWMAVSVDALQLSADSLVADELELSTFNAACGAQHPSGRWWTYSTPMDGAREASAHSIVFQARAGTPELNCCSVNGPRGLGMLSQWAVLRADGALVINYYGPGEARVRVNDKLSVTLVQETTYPRDGRVVIRLREVEAAEKPAAFALRLRIPAWSRKTTVRVNGQPLSEVRAGRYCNLERAWQPGDTIELDMDLGLRYEAGDLQTAGRVSLYRGPLLLAFDQQDNPGDEGAISAVDVTRLDEAVISVPEIAAGTAGATPREVRRPWLRVQLPVGDNQTLRLRDFASAGSAGTRYRSWLPAVNAAPPPPVAWQPADGSAVPAGRILFTWRRPATTQGETRRHRVKIASDPAFTRPVVSYGDVVGERLILPASESAKLKPGDLYYWTLVATNAHGETDAVGPAKSLRIDPKLPMLDEAALVPFGQRADGVLIEAPLSGNPEPTYGKLAEARGWQAAPGLNPGPRGAIELDGRQGLLRYSLQRRYSLQLFPDDYTFAVKCKFSTSAFAAPRADQVQQIASAWCQSVDDPLRLCLDHGKLFARVEAGGVFSTLGVPVVPARPYHLAVVKEGAWLRLFVDGEPRGDTLVPVTLSSKATDLALGGNPHSTGDEYLAACLEKFQFYARALSPDEVRDLAIADQGTK